MKWWLLGFAIFYAAGFSMILILNLCIGPVTPGLALVRAAVWPVWIATGRPEGQRAMMD